MDNAKSDHRIRLLAGLEFASGRFSPERFTLSVATFNERAILVYEHNTNSGEYLFLSMASAA